MGLAILVLVIFTCLAVQAFFAASEIAIVSADDIKIRASSQRGSSDSRLLSSLLEHRDRLLALVLTSTNLATVIAAVVLTSFMHRIGPGYDYLAPFILAPLTLFFGESMPKLLTLRHPLGFVRFAARPLNFLSVALGPLISLETFLSGRLRKLAGVAPETQDVFLTREDLALLLHRHSDGKEPGHDAILPSERQMIGRVFRFAGVEARKVMVPLVRVEALPRTATLAQAVEMVRREGFSRLPVYDERIVNIVGVVHSFDLLEAPDLNHTVGELMRPVTYFSEATPLDEVLGTMQKTGENLAVVVDEYGGAAGIITLEDLIEEIVGEIEDEYDVREELVRVINPRALMIAGQAPVAELNERFGLQLPERDEYASIGGLVVERLGHIPKPSEQLKVGDLSIIVVRSDARAVRELLVHLSQPLRAEAARRR